MIVKAADPEEYEAISEMVERANNHSTLESTIIKATTREDPAFQKGDLRVVKVDGTIMGTAMLIRRPIRIGTALVKGALVAPVATHPDHQRKGYCSAVMKNLIQYMQTQGLELSLLWGIPWLYPRYGYSPAMVKTELVIKPQQSASVETGPYESRPFKEADVPQITHIYHQNTATRTCAEVRAPTMWTWKPRSSTVTLEVVINTEGDVRGYFALGTDWGRPCAHEIGVQDEEACRDIWNRLLDTAQKKKLKEFVCLLHPSHPFTRFALHQNGEIRIRSEGGAGMARVLNLGPLLTTMEKEWTRRLSASALHGIECTLTIASGGQSAVFDITHGQVSVRETGTESDYQLDTPLECLNPLITGYKTISEIATNPQVNVKGGKRAMHLLDVLFPTRLPFGGHLPLFWE